MLPTTIPHEKQLLLSQLIDSLKTVSGIGAIVLGGSYARGTQTASSDLDVALYYSKATPFAIDDVRSVARSIATVGEPTVTGLYEWGGWVNGGAWIQTAAGKVDFLYRNLEQVQRTIDEAHQGIQHHDYAQQPAYGFYSVIYLAETQCCVPLYDPHGWIAHLKEQVAVYPAQLKEKVIASSLWSAEFTLMHARSFAEKGDIYNTVGCFTRTASNLTQALFALNEVYFMSDKKVMEMIAGFTAKPNSYIERLEALLAHPGASEEELKNSYSQMEALWQDVKALSASYQARWNIY